MTTVRQSTGTALIAMAMMAAAYAGPADAVLDTSFDEKGIRTLAYGGVDLLADGEFRVTGIFFKKPNSDVYSADLAAGRRSYQGQTVEFAYAWGSVLITPAVQAGRIEFDVALSNDHAMDELVGVYLQIAVLKFPATPKLENRSWLFYMQASMAHNLGQPGIVAARYGKGLVAVCSEDVVRPLASGFGPAPGGATNIMPVVVYTSRHPMLKEKFPFIDRPIPPGGRDRYRVSLRFAAAAADLTALTGDLYGRYAEAYPCEVKWPDRRPIGQLMLSSSGMNWKDNPRGWHHGFGAAKLNIATDEGKEAFKEDLLQYADRAIEVAKQVNAQGVIVWDVEGQEQPHMISFLGDPRSLAPEMSLPVVDGTNSRPVVDVFFQRLRDAGLIPGLCIRPQRPMRPAYGEKVEQVSWVDPRARLDNVAAKIKYAMDRWGCRIFYLDSDVAWYGDPVAIPGAGGYSALPDAEMLKKLIGRFPGILMVPEWENLRCYAYSAPYTQLNYNKLTAPPDDVLRTYPQAFFVNRIGTADGEPVKERLAESVRRGDVLFYTGWYNAPENKLVQDIYTLGVKQPSAR